MIDFGKLNPAQAQAAMATNGAVLVFAGAGSGKTRVLIYRIAHIIEQGLANPYEILAITFTNKAANEMKERIAQMTPNVNDMWVCTIHSMCTRILRADIDKIGFDRNFSIFTDNEKERVLKQIIAEFLTEDDKLLKNSKWHISNIKSNNFDLSVYEIEYEHTKNIKLYIQIYELYQMRLMQQNALDFDDLINKTYELLSFCPEVLTKYSKRFKFLHIDEFQDTNNIQYEVIKMLSSYHNNIFAVGDDDQSIYGWRGANIEIILNFEKEFKGASVFKLEENYRSTKKILECANRIISKNTVRAEKVLFTSNADGVKPEFYSAFSETNEAEYVAGVIKSLVRFSNVSLNEIAILFRINALSRSFEQAFLNYNIAHKVYGGLKFFDRKEIKDLIAYLRCVTNPKDDEAFVRIINVPKRGIGDTSVDKILQIAKSKGLTFYEVIKNIDNCVEFNSGAKTKIREFYNVISLIIEKAPELKSLEFTEYLINATGYLNQYAEKTEENLNKKLNVSEFVNYVEEYAEANPDATVLDLIQTVALSSEIDSYNDEEAKVTLATVHAVKGLEFRVVFMVGMDEKYFPITRSFDIEENLDEERRLAYVAITRAKERLYFTRAASRFSHQTRGRTPTMASRYLAELGELIGFKTFGRESRDIEFEREYGLHSTSDSIGSSSTAVNNYFAIKNKTAVDKKYEDYAVGVKVSHIKFGMGLIIKTSGVGENTIADIKFEGVGVKTLSVKYAPLEIIR